MSQGVFGIPPVPEGAFAGREGQFDPINGALIVDTPCRKCAYNLRGLTAGGRCPECGSAVGLSIVGDLMRFSDPSWVDRLALGCLLILWGLLADLVGTVLGVVMSTVAPVIGGIVQLAGSAIGLWGAWLLTSPDPSGIGEQEYGKARRITRAALLAGLIGEAAAILVDALPLPPVAMITFGLLMILLALFSIVGAYYLLVYLERLSARIPNVVLAGKARAIRLGFVITYSVIVVGGALLGMLAGMGAIGPGGLGGGGAGGAGFLALPLGCVMFVAAIALLVYTIRLIVLYFALRRALHEQALFARQTWAASAFGAGTATAPNPR